MNRERDTGLRRVTLTRLALAAAVSCVAVILLGGVLSDGQQPPAARPATPFAAGEQTALGDLVSGFATGDTAAFVARLEAQVAGPGRDGLSLTLLGLAYQQRARETGDPTFFSRSSEALARAATERRAPQSLISQGRASLANSRHQFTKGLALARRAVAQDPENAGAYGALGDALHNLGRYAEAFRAYDRMVVLAPGISSLTRVASARELLGRPEAAARAARFALSIDHAVPEHVSWTRVLLGNIDFNRGRVDRAAAQYRRALRQSPGYVHAEAGLARVEAARGRYGSAEARLRRVVSALPIPAYAILLGDVLHASGRDRAAASQYDLVSAIEKLFAANGVSTDLQTAVFDLDHRRNVGGALARARSAYREAPGIVAEDALAWGLFRAGRCREARAHSVAALRFGTRDALFFFHRGIIERCLGNPSARAWFVLALDTNPHFSLLWAPVARKEIVGAGHRARPGRLADLRM
jgi:tetratricopeptide (TPR) repeat protein